jgi:3-oxoacyl-[acyl-carrier-protein] synthase II
MLFPLPPTPNKPPRVVITGAGIVTALGQGWEPNALGFRSGRTAFRPVTLFDVSKQRVKTAAEVSLPAALPPNLLGAHQQRRLDRADRLLLLAAQEAFAQSGWETGERIPFVVGTTAGGMALGETYYRLALQTPGQRRGQATRALYYQCQTQGRLVAEALGLNGEVRVVSNACASGANAIGEAWECLRRGQAERVLTGGYDALCQLVFCGFDSLQALSPTSTRPFDAGRDGLALGEGAGVLALETLESARRRNAVILGELAGYGASLDLHHLTQPHPEGAAAVTSMRLACEQAGVSPGDIDYINAHGTGTPLNDSAEARAIAAWAGECVRSLPVSSTKAGIGHLLGAAGAVEAVACLMALRGQWLPPELAFEHPDPACAFPIVHEPQDAPIKTALSNSFGFGGVNATLVFRRWE